LAYAIWLKTESTQLRFSIEETIAQLENSIASDDGETAFLLRLSGLNLKRRTFRDHWALLGKECLFLRASLGNWVQNFLVK
jgi:hypothetical protein